MKKLIFLVLGIVCLSAVAMGVSDCTCSGGEKKAAQSGQLLEIFDVDGSCAKARLTIDGEEIFVTDVFIGQKGLGKQREGDRKTPVGTLHIKGAFGVKPNPGTSINYIDVTPSIFACGDNNAYYNQVIDTAALHHKCNGEDMYHIVPEYNYGMMTDYNAACVPGLGSAIFIHYKGSKAYTAGCIAFDEERMIEILRRCDSTLVVKVGK